MRIGIVGLGYWGNIILKNLISLGYNDISLCEKAPKKEIKDYGYPILEDYKDLDCDKVFITTPTKTHYNICNYFLEKGVDVFCEKPLTTSSKYAEKLYSTAKEHNCILFTDWIFTFNSHIEQIKKDYENGKLKNIKSVQMNRLNLGPKRFDVNARWDLASHDISIILYIFEDFPTDIQWTDYKRNNGGTQEDSSLGLITFENFVAIVNASWEYMKKIRECTFEFENYYVIWDDYKQFLQYEDLSNVDYPIYSGNISYPCRSYKEPLKTSIRSFFDFNKEDMSKQRNLTVNTIKILENDV